MLRTIYIIDSILLFNPEIAVDKEQYKYENIQKDIEYLKNIGIVFFVTADINSIFQITFKMKKIFSLIKPLVIILQDDNSKKIVTYCHVLGMEFKKNYEEKLKETLLQKTRYQINELKNQRVNKTIHWNAAPIYLKTTRSYGIQSGGAVAHSAGVLKALTKIYPNTVVYTTDYIPKDLNIQKLNHISIRGFHDFLELNSLYFNFSAYREICDKQKNNVPAFVYQRYSLNDFLGLKLSKKYRVPFVLEYNGSFNWMRKNWEGKVSCSNWVDEIERLNLEKADLIICVSEESKATLVKQNINSDKIIVAYNGVDEQKYNPDVNDFNVRNKYKLTNKVVIGFCGSFVKFHGVEKLAEAYGNLISHNTFYRNTTCLFLIGEGAELPKVRRILKRFKADECVRYAGSVPFEEMPSYLAACDILVAPHIRNSDGSEFFGSPTKLFEYMAMGKAIAASNLNQIGDILKNGESALLFEPGNVIEMEKIFISLIEDDELRKRLGESARKDVMANYTWDKHVEKILKKLTVLYT